MSLISRVAVAVFCTLLPAARPALATPPDDAAAAIGGWIEDLNSDLYVVRERAMSRLEQAGPAALDQLALAAESSNLEVATRAVRLMLQLSEAEDVEVAIAALKRIAALKNRPAEQRAAEAISQGLHAREALAAIVRLGGEVEGRYEIDGQVVIDHLHLGEQWKGGDEGLQHLRDLEPVRRLSIHSAPVTDEGLAHLNELSHLVRLELYGTDITRAAAERLAEKMPGVEIDFRGGAMLGIGGIAHAKGAQVTFVQGQSAAARASLLPGDIITAFNGQAFQGFDELTAFIARCHPNDQATLEILRDGQTFSKDVRFGAWK